MKSLLNVFIVLGIIIGTILFMFIVESFLMFVFTGVIGRITLYYPELYIITTLITLFFVISFVCVTDDSDLFY